MNKNFFIFLLGCLLSLCSCDNNDDPIYETPVYNNFPESFDIPSPGGKFSIRQSWNNDYEMTRCEASIILGSSEKEGDDTVFTDTIQSHTAILIGGNGKKHTYVDRYYNSWFEIRKVNTQEISLTVSPNQTGEKRYIQLWICDFYHLGMPTRIWMEQEAE